MAQVGSNSDVVRSYLGAFAVGDPDEIAGFVTDGFSNEHLSELGSGCEGRDEYRRRLPGFLSTFVDVRYTILEFGEVHDDGLGDGVSDLGHGVGDGFGDGDGHADGVEVVVRYRLEATFEGTAIDIPGMMWFTVDGGLIARRVDLWDSLTFLRQTGQDPT